MNSLFLEIIVHTPVIYRWLTHLKDIVGRVFFRYWPINAAGTTPEVKYPL